MSNISEIYSFVANCIVNQAYESWINSELKIEISEGVIGYNGGFINEKGDFKSFLVREFPSELRKQIKKLHQLTTEGSHNRWNRAIFKLWPDGKFDMEFIWDQDLHDEIERLS